MPSESKSDDIKRILVIRFSSLGDIVLTTPVLSALRDKFLSAQIDFLLKEQHASLLENHPARIEIIKLPEDVRSNARKFIEFAEGLKKNNYDLVVDLQGNARSMVLRRRLGARSVKVNKDTLSRLLLVKFKIGKNKIPDVRKRFLGALKKLGIGQTVIPRTSLLVTPEEYLTIDKKYLDGIDKGELVAIHPGARWELKEWGRRKYSALAKMLIDNGFSVVFFDAQCEDDPKENIVYIKDCSLREMMALIGRSRAFIGNDSGPLHIAVALKIPAIGIFGPTHRSLGYAPSYNEATIIEMELGCRPCTLYGAGSCRKNNRICMENIDPKVIFDAVIEKFDKEQI